MDTSATMPVTSTAPAVATAPVATAPLATGGAVNVGKTADGDAAAGVPDNFVVLDGIGPKVALALNAAGIRTFAQLAEADEATLRAAIRAAGMRSAPSLVTWSGQAKALAEGKAAGS